MKFNPYRLILSLALIIAGLVIANYLVFKKINKQPQPKPPAELPPARPAQKPPPPDSAVKPAQPKISIVIDDLGTDLTVADTLYRISPKITLAILPFQSFSQKIARLAQQRGQTTLLHLPLEPHDELGKFPKPSYMLLLEENNAIMLRQLRDSLCNVPGIAGVNNHMGSRFTEDNSHMNLILEEIKQRGLFFLDSRTTPRSVGYDVACQMGIPALKRDVFLDNELEAAAIAAQLEKLITIARKKGQAIGIGHPHPQTLAELAKFVARLPNAGVELVELPGLL